MNQTPYIHALWTAADAYITFFAMGGGGNRYPGFNEEEIPAAIGILLLRKLDRLIEEPDESRLIVSPEFWQRTRDITQELESRMSRLENPDVKDAEGLIREYVRYIEGKIKPERGGPWTRFRELQGCTAAFSDADRDEGP